jgi:hypothetical protein
MNSRPLCLFLSGGFAMSTFAGGVFWTDRGANRLMRMDFDGSNLAAISLSGTVALPGTNLRGIAVDSFSHRIFWADNAADQILRCSADGSDSRVLYRIPGGNAFPADIRLDLKNGFLYWCDQTRSLIQRSSLNGEFVTDIITNAAPTGPYFLDLDVLVGKLYWGDFGGGSIYRANWDGTGRETILSGNNNTRGVRVDSIHQMLYWINRDDKKVHRCPLQTFDKGPILLTDPAVQTLYSNLDTPHGLVLDIPARKLYWADTGTNPGSGAGGQSICRGDLDGSSPMEILATGNEPWDVDLDLTCGSYGEWVKRCFRRDAPTELTEPNADPDADGIVNLVEYALDSAPLSPDGAALPRGAIVPGLAAGEFHHALSYSERISSADLRYSVQASTNLVPWEGESFSFPTAVSQTVLREGGLQDITRQTTYPVSSLKSHYLRLILVPVNPP